MDEFLNKPIGKQLLLDAILTWAPKDDEEPVTVQSEGRG